MPTKPAKSMWTIKQSATPGMLEIYIYGDVEGDYYDWWGDLVESDTSAKHFKAELEKYPDAHEILLYINSYGGDVFEGTAIYNQLKRHPAHKTVYIDGFACSIASVIAMAGDKVVMPKNTLMMIHDMWRVAVGNARDLRKAADDLDVINAAGRQAYLTKAAGKLDEKKLVQLMEAETWLTAEQCIELGLADEYAEADADMQAAGELLRQATLGLEQTLQLRRGIAASLRELSEPAPEPEPEPVNEPVIKPSIMEMLAGIKEDNK